MAKLSVVTESGIANCQVVKHLGFNHDVGMYAKVVLHDGKEKTAVKDGGIWRLWGPKDRIQPILEELRRRAREKMNSLPD